jgi:peptidoglycan/LPS O-acetylase OafA/YrhL
VNQSSPYKSTYRSEIDGLRAFAVLSVVAFHAFPGWLKGGFIGVDVFFVISGFLITSHIFENLDKGQFSFIDFFGRRIRRIFPALILVLACSLAFGWFALVADEYAQLGKHVASGAAFINNFILVAESGYFDSAAETKPMLHLWSLAVEEQFYILWPLLLWLAWKRKFNLLTITTVVAVISFYLNLRFVKSYPTEMFFWPVGRFWELLSGSVLGWLLLYRSELLSKFKLWIDKYLVRIINSKEVVVDGSTVSNVMSFFGLLLLSYGVIRINESLTFPSAWALIPVLGAVLVIASGSKSWLNRIFLMNPVAVWFGLISYPLYLLHWPILSFLQIIDGEVPHRDARIAAVLLSIALAWFTYKFIEKPIRFGSFKRKINSLFIAFVLFFVGGFGFYVSATDWSETNGYEDVIFERKGFAHAFGASLRWYKGEGDWLFLGNDYDNTVAKRRLAMRPSDEYISKVVAQFSALAEKGEESNTKVALLVGPNKSSVYTEYLPKKMMPSDRRYSAIITDHLSKIPNLTANDPTELLVKSKSTEGLLHWRTDTHWNQKGAFIAFKSLLDGLELKCPNVEFALEGTHKGDLIRISQLDDFPIHADDNWKYRIKADSQIVREELHGQPKDTFGWKGKVVNSKALNDMSVWVIGDSFTNAIRPYLEASFKEVSYIGHWSKKLNTLPLELSNSAEKPDLVLVVRVERSF